ncbi:MAG: hypothetical protein M5R36_07680 [Deltaproteobacteria bacterium]|nr:hypothetical protein [Deltaproteobacteria bacterium]
MAGADNVDKLKATLYLRSVVPLARVLREEESKKFYDKWLGSFSAVVQFCVAGEDEPATQLVFEKGSSPPPSAGTRTRR